MKDGDEVEVYLDYGASNIKVQQISKVDLKNMSVGFYKVGTDIPAGTYTLEIDNPVDDNDLANIDIHDNNIMKWILFI